VKSVERNNLKRIKLNQSHHILKLYNIASVSKSILIVCCVLLKGSILENAQRE